MSEPLNPPQAVAAAHRGGPYLLEAGPGTGKTQTLDRAGRSLLDEGVDPCGSSCCTFSNKAAGEMAERIARQVARAGRGDVDRHVPRLRPRHHPASQRRSSRLPSDPRLMDRVEAVELLEAEFPRLALEHYQDLYDPTRLIGDILAASRARRTRWSTPRPMPCSPRQMRVAAGGDEPRRTRRRSKAAEVGAGLRGLRTAEARRAGRSTSATSSRSRSSCSRRGRTSAKLGAVRPSSSSTSIRT